MFTAPAATDKVFAILYSATHCNTLQQAATRCNKLQHTYAMKRSWKNRIVSIFMSTAPAIMAAV